MSVIATGIEISDDMGYIVETFIYVLLGAILQAILINFSLIYNLRKIISSLIINLDTSLEEEDLKKGIGKKFQATEARGIP